MTGPLAAVLLTVALAVVAVVVVIRFTKRLVLRALAAVIALVVGYFGVTFVQVWATSHRNDPVQAQAIIVLGAAQYNGVPSPALENRLSRAYDLWKQGLAPVIVTTGGRQPGDTYTEATAGYDWLTAKGVPGSAILKEVQGHTTYESMAAAAAFLRQRGMTKVLLVSDDYHNARLLAIAHEVHLSAHVAPAPDHRSNASELRQLARETVAVSVGRVIGFRRLDGR